MPRKLHDYVVHRDGVYYAPKFKKGWYVKRRGEQIEGEIEGWTFFSGLPSFHYWVKGFGAAIPEEHLYKIKRPTPTIPRQPPKGPKMPPRN